MGFLSTSGYDGADYCNKPVLGHLWQLREILQSHVVDEVMITTSIGDAVAEWVIDTCKEKGITVRFAVEIPPAGNNFKYYVETVGIGRFLLSLEAVPQDIVPLLIKRSIDVIGASVGLVLCAITYIWYAPLMRRESPGPVLFRQTRVGQNGRQFTLYKFRTMYLDAEEKLPTLQSRNEMRGSIFKMKNDPRVTSAGRTLRRRHLDELPQFWNVLLGEISLVGTRPPTPKEVSQYEYHQYRRLSMRPGLTGLWQLKGNGAISDFEDIVKLDCDYIDNWSLWLDCKILAKTVMKVARGDAW
jgi:exopolysaccharide biosynthesis polyprenyl glycosylphosphotransferase